MHVCSSRATTRVVRRRSRSRRPGLWGVERLSAAGERCRGCTPSAIMKVCNAMTRSGDGSGGSQAQISCRPSASSVRHSTSAMTSTRAWTSPGSPLMIGRCTHIRSSRLRADGSATAWCVWPSVIVVTARLPSPPACRSLQASSELEVGVLGIRHKLIGLHAAAAARHLVCGAGREPTERCCPSSGLRMPAAQIRSVDQIDEGVGLGDAHHFVQVMTAVAQVEHRHRPGRYLVARPCRLPASGPWPGRTGRPCPGCP